ncbi:MAG TPA: hypothetical protein VD835_03830, partial [Pyrinomonadaceae bacterium]|nr:hypothetical protein [Pyrinomonadaceae bacterium]
LGTSADNNRDRHAKGRTANGTYAAPSKHPERHRWKPDHPWRKNPELIPRGERCTFAKLTAEQVKQIRARYTGKHGEVSQLAREFGINFRTVSIILKGRTWTHV